MIELIDLCKHFGRVKAVDHLTLHVPKGELFCFLGPNGAGKTTTMKILTGLLHPDRGTARIAGFDVVADPMKVKRLIGYIPDMPFMYERLTAVEFLQFIGDLYDLPENTVAGESESLLALFGLLDYRSALVKDLSHGMRQRLIYAATFLHRPEVLFIDEPLIGLDPYSIRLIKDLLREKAKGGMTIFLTTHILTLAEDIADRIGIILHGRLVALGSIGELLSQQTDSTRLEDFFLRLTAQHDTKDSHVGDFRAP
jgi:ABC-2 type transport system ATP-binding protein